MRNIFEILPSFYFWSLTLLLLLPLLLLLLLSLSQMLFCCLLILRQGSRESPQEILKFPGAPREFPENETGF